MTLTLLCFDELLQDIMHEFFLSEISLERVPLIDNAQGEFWLHFFFNEDFEIVYPAFYTSRKVQQVSFFLQLLTECVHALLMLFWVEPKLRVPNGLSKVACVVAIDLGFIDTFYSPHYIDYKGLALVALVEASKNLVKTLDDKVIIRKVGFKLTQATNLSDSKSWVGSH